MVAIKNILLFVTAATGTILSDISTIDSNVKSLTSAVNNFNGGLFAALPITTAVSNLEKAINQGTSDAQATSQLSSFRLQCDHCGHPKPHPRIETSLTAVKNKKSQFVSAGLTSSVQNDLATLK